MDRLNRRIGAGLALGRASPAHAPSVTRAAPAAAGAGPAATAAGAAPAGIAAVTGAGPAVTVIGTGLGRGSGMAATRACSRWASARNQPPRPRAHAVYSHTA